MTPNLLLMKAYQTEDVYQAKLAGGPPGGPVMAALNYELSRHHQTEATEQQRQAALMNQLFRELEHERVGPAEDALQYTPIPYSSMTRLASVGADVAKTAGIGDFTGPLWKGIQAAAKGVAGGANAAGQRGINAISAGQGAANKAIAGGVAKVKNIPNQANAAMASAGQKAQQKLEAFGQKAQQMGAGTVQKAPTSIPPPATAQAAAAVGKPQAEQGLLDKAGLTKGLGWKVPLAAGVIGTGYMASKAGKGALGYMSQEGSPQSYGSGSPLSYGTNQYGQPQGGSPFIG